VTSCRIKLLPDDAVTPAAMMRAPGDPLRLAVITAKYWGAEPRTLGVQFLDTADTTLQQKILAHMNAWNVGVSFAKTNNPGEIRVARIPGDGYWSYLGRDVLEIPQDEPTMNLEGFTLATSNREFTRVVRHETGHTLGFPHEHLRREVVERIDPATAYAYFGAAPNFWDKQTVDLNVLTPLEERSVMASTIDVTSVMAYALPASIMRDGVAVPGGNDLTATDRAFAAEKYPTATVVTVSWLRAWWESIKNLWKRA
jgi:hypothetical protein